MLALCHPIRSIGRIVHLESEASGEDGGQHGKVVSKNSAAVILALVNWGRRVVVGRWSVVDLPVEGVCEGLRDARLAPVNEAGRQGVCLSIP